MKSISQKLSQSAFFDGITAGGREALAAASRLKKLKKREYLFHEGDSGEAMFLLVQGSIQLHKSTEDGKDIVIKLLRPQEIFAEVVLFERSDYPVSALAVAASEVVVMPKRKMLELLEQPTFRSDFIAMLLRKQRHLTERIRYLSSYDLEQRFRMFLDEHYGRHEFLPCRISKKDAAAAIGSTPESLSRLLLRLKESGDLVWSKDGITVKPEFWG